MAVAVAVAAAPSPGAKAADLGKRLGGAKVAADGPDGLVTFVGSAPGKTLTGAKGSVAASAEALLEVTAPSIGADAGSLNPVRTTRTLAGGHAVRYQQTYQGIPVFAGEVTVQLDASGATRSLVSDVSADPADDTTPTISAADATAAALEATGKAHPGHGPLSAAAPKLWIYDPAVLDAPGLPGARLVWRTEVKAAEGEPIREIVLVDADTGGIALNFNQIAEAKDRKVCDANNVIGAADRCGGALPVIRNEGGAAVALAEANTAYDYAGDTYDYYLTQFGRDSLDGAGMSLYSTVRHCESGNPCPYANAFWSGAQMHYGQGYAAADDVVGHELSHGVTEFSSNLYYYYQSGAINEALSDIFGEFMDLTNGHGNDTPGVRWLLGEDLPIGAIRNMANPPAFSDPDRMRSGNYYGGTADSGGVHTNSGVANKAAFLTVDGGSFNGVDVTGIGITKAGRVWYEAATSFLTSGSDYGNLDVALVQACNNLVGTGGITAGDCTQVSLATDATEMQLSPSVTGATDEAPVCAAGQSPTYLFDDDIEGALNWVSSSSSVWGLATGYAASGTQSLYGRDLTTTQNHTMRMINNVTIPAGATAYARFNHAFDFEPTYDGGQVEISTNSGGSWSNAGPLIVNNGYNGTLNAANPLGAVAAYTDRSLGYTSSRINLSSAAGGSVRLGFRVASDSSQGDLGWLIDDVQIYTCAAAPALLRVTTSPAVPSVISVDGIERDSWGINWAALPVGSHEVCFGKVLGWITPSCQTVNLTAGNTTTVTGTFSQSGYLGWSPARRCRPPSP
ncbi:MAG: M4 family metallopeptidase [Acidimicrobiales bacterium]